MRAVVTLIIGAILLIVLLGRCNSASKAEYDRGYDDGYDDGYNDGSFAVCDELSSVSEALEAHLQTCR